MLLGTWMPMLAEKEISQCPERRTWPIFLKRFRSPSRRSRGDFKRRTWPAPSGSSVNVVPSKNSFLKSASAFPTSTAASTAITFLSQPAIVTWAWVLSIEQLARRRRVGLSFGLGVLESIRRTDGWIRPCRGRGCRERKP
jgi:hypothetical protein